MIRLIRVGPPSQVCVDLQFRATPEAHAVDLKVLEHSLDIVACLGERNALDPVDRVDLGIARVAIPGDPVLDPSASGIVAGDRENVGAAIDCRQLMTKSRRLSS